MYPAYTPVHDPTAVMGKRFGAFLIDAAIVFLVAMALFVVFVERRDFGSSFAAEQFCDRLNATEDFICAPAESAAFFLTTGNWLIVLAVSFGVWFLNDAILTGLAGGSLGKLLVGIRVVRHADGNHAGFWRSVGRWAMWIADAAPYCFPLVGLIVGLSTKGHRRVGDLVCGTLVISKADVGRPPIVPGLSSPTSQAGYPPPGGYSGSYGPSSYGPSPYGAPSQQPPAGWGPPSQQPPTGWDPPTQQPPTSWNPPGPVAPPAWGSPQTPNSGPPTPPNPDAPISWEPPPSSYPTPSPYPTPPHPTPSPGQAPDAAGNPQGPTVAQPVAPSGEPTSVMPTPASVGGPGVGSPLWDDARDTYIQWDPDINRWVEWDESNRVWHPI